MRKIERKMLDAILCAIRPVPVMTWKETNTEVNTTHPKQCRVVLHGHVIALITDNGQSYNVEINLCGWNTPTTRSRLSSILQTFVPECCGVGTKLGQPSIRFMDSSKDRDIASDGWINV